MNTYTYYDASGNIVINYMGTLVEEIDTLYPDLQRIDGDFSRSKYKIIAGDAVLIAE